MAKRTQVIMVDDLDGEVIADEGQTVSFSVGSIAYEIDLNEVNAQKFHELLAPYVAAARRVEASAESAGSPPDLPTIRAWAKANGVKVSARGRVSREVQDAYLAAH